MQGCQSGPAFFIFQLFISAIGLENKIAQMTKLPTPQDDKHITISCLRVEIRFDKYHIVSKIKIYIDKNEMKKPNLL